MLLLLTLLATVPPSMADTVRYRLLPLTAPGRIRDGYVGIKQDFYYSSVFSCGILTYHEGASTFVSCPSTPTLATCNLATPAFDPTKHFVPDDAYDQCKVYTTLSGIVSPVTPKIKQYHVAANTSTSGLTSYLDSNNYCTSEGWEFGTIMSLDDVDDYNVQISAEVENRCVYECRTWLHVSRDTEQWYEGSPVDYSVTSKDGDESNSCSARTWHEPPTLQWVPCSKHFPVLCQEFILA